MKIFREKISDRIIIIGLSSVAVLCVLGDALLKIADIFPDKNTSLGRALSNIARNQSRSIKDYLEILKKSTGFNLNLVLHRLERKGLVCRSSNGYALTKYGEAFLDKLASKMNKEYEWDGKWRLVMFDIPEKKRSDRNWLRSILMNHSYTCLQKSVFIGKKPLYEDVYKELDVRGLSRYVRLLTIGEIDIDLDVMS